MKFSSRKASVARSALVHRFGNSRCLLSARISRDDITRRICHNVKRSQAARADGFPAPRCEAPSRSPPRPVNTEILSLHGALPRSPIGCVQGTDSLLTFTIYRNCRLPHVCSRHCCDSAKGHFKCLFSPADVISPSFFGKLSGYNSDCRSLLRNSSADVVVRCTDDKSLIASAHRCNIINVLIVHQFKKFHVI